MSNVVTLVTGEDWSGLYVNGVLVEQGHQIPQRHVIEHLARIEGEYTSESVIPNQQWIEDRGNLPNDLSEVIAD